jgi:hypothetical protein
MNLPENPMTKSLNIRRLRSSAFALLGLAIGSAVLVTPTASLAHHAFAAEYDGDKPIALEGVVERVRFVNPHSWLYLNVKGSDGAVTKWALEFGSPNSLANAGLSKDDVKPGSKVKIKGFRAKSVMPIGYCSTLTLADGRSVKTGGAGDAPGTAN